MVTETQKYLVIWIAVLLPAVLLMIGAGYGVFMYMKASKNLSTTNKIVQGALGPFSLFFKNLNSKEGNRNLKRAFVFSIAFVLYVGVVFLVFEGLVKTV